MTKKLKNNHKLDAFVPPSNHKLVIAISSRALFDLDQSHAVFETTDVEQYSHYQIEHENEILLPGVAFSLVKKLLVLNSLND